jgi:hypothetical protein
MLGESAVESISQIEKLFSKNTPLPVSDAVKLRAAQRAINNTAPFHRQRNSMKDAILIEMYAEVLNQMAAPGDRFAFVTHNKKDFSHPSANEKHPHPDIANLFSRVKSRYYTGLGEALKQVAPNLVTDLMLEQEWTEEPRRLAEILEASEKLFDIIWYNRHQNLRIQIEKGEIKLVDKQKMTDRNVCQRDIWASAQKSAKRLEKKYGPKKLGPWDDFEWGMINGKLSALRWVLGDDWDMLDT